MLKLLPSGLEQEELSLGRRQGRPWPAERDPDRWRIVLNLLYPAARSPADRSPGSSFFNTERPFRLLSA